MPSRVDRIAPLSLKGHALNQGSGTGFNLKRDDLKSKNNQNSCVINGTRNPHTVLIIMPLVFPASPSQAYVVANIGNNSYNDSYST